MGSRTLIVSVHADTKVKFWDRTLAHARAVMERKCAIKSTCHHRVRNNVPKHFVHPRGEVEVLGQSMVFEQSSAVLNGQKHSG